MRTFRSAKAFSLVEGVIAMTLMASVLVGFLATFVQSRRLTESSVLHAAASSLVYGIVEQMKGIDYLTLLPSQVVDPDAPAAAVPPHVRLRINQDLTVWLRVVHTTDPDNPQGPLDTPAADVTAASLGAIDNVIGPLALSSATGTASQQLTLVVWLWIDEIVPAGDDVEDVKKITLVYTYSYSDGSGIRTIRDREVFLRTRYDQ